MDKNQVKKQFSTECLGKVGTIEGGDGIPVQITSLSASWHSIADRNKRFGCLPGVDTLLVEWVPAGMQHTPRQAGELPKEAGVDESKIPPRKQWVVFPTQFEGLPVCYCRGHMAFLL